MMAAAPTTNTAAGYATAAMAFSFGGVSTEHFLLGCLCYMVGAAGRQGLKISKAFEAQQKPNWGSAIGTVSVAPFLAAFASMSLFLGAHIIGFEGDAGIALVLVLAALKGPEGIEYITTLVSKAVPSKLGGSTNQEPKP